MAAPISKTRWEYSNGAQETESETFADGQVVQYQRSFLVPIPYTENTITQIVTAIDPNNANWRTSLIQSLATNHFFTNNIAMSQGRDSGYKLSAYLSSRTFLKNATKATALGALVITAAFAPSIANAVAPESMETLGLDEDTQIETQSSIIRNIGYSAKVWWKVLSGQSFQGGLAGGMAAVATTTSIIFLGKHLFHQLTKTIGPKEFEDWKNHKLAIMQSNKMIPQALHQYINWPHTCPITADPIRVPARTQCQHLFEEAALLAWINQCFANGTIPTCPMDRQPLLNPNGQYYVIDMALSDDIELQIFFLKALQENRLALPQQQLP